MSLLVVSICRSLRSIEIFDKKEETELDKINTDLDTSKNSSNFLLGKFSEKEEKSDHKKPNKFSSQLRMILLNVFFIALLISVANSSHSKQTFHCQNYFRNLFHFHEGNSQTMKNVDAVWEWISENFIKILNSLNDQESSSNFIFGDILLTQTRDDSSELTFFVSF